MKKIDRDDHEPEGTRRIISIIRPKIHADSRGRVFEVLRGSSLAAQRFGQIYVFTSKPGQVKGNHVHSRKWEYFLAVRGKGLLTALEMRTGARESVTLDAGDPCVAILRPGVAHAVKNDGAEELVVVAYVSEEFDPVDSDTIAVDVLGGVS